MPATILIAVGAFAALLGDSLNLVQIVPEDLDADHRANARGEHVDPVDDRLGPDVPPPGHLESGIHLLHDIGFRLVPEEELATQTLSFGGL